MQPLNAEDPDRIGGYRLLGRLGEGGMGRVYLARSERGRTVAVKVVRAELAQQDDFRKRFALEINAARRVGSPDHASDGPQGAGTRTEWTAPVLDADTEAATPWVATGYVAGPALSEVVDKQYGPLPRASVLGLASGLTQALRAVHGAGLVHRDLKPSNVLITIDGPRVIDFGIARALDTTVQSGGGLTRTGGLVGSPGFMSPEQVRGERVTGASDVFCLGAVLAYAATGRMPFGSADSGMHALLFRIAEEEPDLGGLDGELLDIVTACLAKEPAARPSLDDLAARTDGALDNRAWLPGEVFAELGRHAVQLLDKEDPDGGPHREAPPAEKPGASEQPGAGGVFGPAPSLTGPAYGTPPGAPQSTPHHSPGPGPYGPLASPPYGPPYAGGPAGPGGTPPPTGPSGTPPPGTGPYEERATGAPAQKERGGPVREARNALGLTIGLNTALVVFMLWLLAFLVVDAIVLTKLDHLITYYEPDEELEDHGFGGLRSVVGMLYLGGWPVLFAVALLWLTWFRRMRLNAEAFAPNGMRYPAMMAVVAWFIPFANLVLPKQILNDVWRASATTPSGKRRPGTPRVPRTLHTVWWLVWLVYLFLFTAGIRWAKATEASTAQSYAVGELLTHGAGLLTAFLAMFVVLRLTRHQHARIRAAAA
ncbi:DUF4328 domain-containing protein [Streptomyces sp. ODS28]|uniref:protein kinase domain-containing protein n=1 Tax=Streptomyces sp. ODS28 TaxID=3136688 RepID=UPI0031E812FF